MPFEPCLKTYVLLCQITRSVIFVVSDVFVHPQLKFNEGQSRKHEVEVMILEEEKVKLEKVQRSQCFLAI